MRKLEIRRGNFNAVCYTADGEYLVGLHSGWRLRIWTTADFRERFAAQLPGTLHRHDSLALTGDLAVMTKGIYSLADLWSRLRATTKAVRGNDLIRVVRQEEGLTSCMMTLVPDGRAVVEARYDYRQLRTELLVKDQRGATQRIYQAPGWIRRLAVSPDRRWAALCANHNLTLLDLERGELAAQFEHTDVPNQALFSPDSAQLAVAAGRSVWLWDVALRSGDRLRAFDTFVEGLAYSPDGTLLAASDRTGEIRFLEPATGKQRASLNFDVGAVHDLAFSPDGMTVAGAGHNNAVVVWDLE